jgi:AAA ATPase domain
VTPIRAFGWAYAPIGNPARDPNGSPARRPRPRVRRASATPPEARAGAPRFVVVSGEPRIGKTSLITAFARAAESGGCLALSGKATELERDFPFGLIVNALDDHLAHLTRFRSTAWRPTSWESLRPHLSSPLRSVRPAGPTGKPRRRAVQRPLRGAGVDRAPGGAHTACPDARRHPVERRRIARAHRPPAQASPRRGRVAGRDPAGRTGAGGAGRGHRGRGAGGKATALELGPLNRDDAARLLSATVEPVALGELYRESAGRHASPSSRPSRITGRTRTLWSGAKAR